MRHKDRVPAARCRACACVIAEVVQMPGSVSVRAVEATHAAGCSRPPPESLLRRARAEGSGVSQRELAALEEAFKC